MKTTVLDDALISFLFFTVDVTDVCVVLVQACGKNLFVVMWPFYFRDNRSGKYFHKSDYFETGKAFVSCLNSL